MKSEALVIEELKEDFNGLDRAVGMLKYSLQQIRERSPLIKGVKGVVKKLTETCPHENGERSFYTVIL